MWPIRRTALLLLATAMGAQDAVAGDDPAPNSEIAWPALRPGARAVWRTEVTVAFSGVGAEDHGGLRATMDRAAEVLAPTSDGVPRIRFTAGRVRGESRAPTDDGRWETRPVLQSLSEVDWREPIFEPIASPPGSTTIASPAEAPTDLDLAVLSPPPDPRVRVGSAWEAARQVTRAAAWPSLWKHRVTAIDDRTVTVVSEAAAGTGTGEAEVRGEGRVERRLSREDGLPASGTVVVTFRLGELTMREEARFERVRPVEPPWEALAVERALAILVGGESGTQAAAAAAIGRLWPYGARAAPILAAALADSETRLPAAVAIEDLSRRAVALLVETVKNLPDPDPTGYRRTVEACEAHGGAVTLSDLASHVVRDPVGGALAAGLLATDRTWGASQEAWGPYLLFFDRATARFAAGMDLADARAHEAASAAVALLALRALPISAAPDAPPEVGDLVASADPVARWTGLRLADLFGNTRPERPAAPIAGVPTCEEVAACKAALAGRNESARRVAALRLAASGQETTASVPILGEWLRDLPTDEALAGDVIGTLGRLGAAADVALPLLDAIRVRRDESRPRHSFHLAVLAAQAASRIDAPNAERVGVLLHAFRPPEEPRRDGALPHEAREAAYEALLGLFDRMETALQDLVIDALLDEVPLGTGPARDGRSIAFVAEHASGSSAAGAALVRAYGRSRDRLGVLLATGAVQEWQGGAERVRALGSEYERPSAARYATLEAVRRFRFGPAADGVRDLARSVASSDDPLLRYLARRAGGAFVPR